VQAINETDWDGNWLAADPPVTIRWTGRPINILHSHLSPAPLLFWGTPWYSESLHDQRRRRKGMGEREEGPLEILSGVQHFLGMS
jgi:hypothetical protein